MVVMCGTSRIGESMEKLALGNRLIGEGERPYIIAELASNHNGDMEIAKRLIKASKDAGADCVKFQSWSKETIFSKIKYFENYFLSDDYRNRPDCSLEKVVDEYSISENQLIEMSEYSASLGISMTSTPFSEREADFLVDVLKSPFIKIASMDLNNLPFLDYLGKKKIPIVLSTGMGTLSEIDQAIRTIERAGCNKIVILHCVAEYPPDDALIHLRKMKTLKMQYPKYEVGFSDHTLGITIPIAALALNATVVEKHITLDKNMEGWDHKVSATPDELSEIVTAAKRIFIALGSSRINVVESKKRREEFRRGAVAAKVLMSGHILKMEDVVFKRPARGVCPNELVYIIGRKLSRSLEADEIIQWEDLV